MASIPLYITGSGVIKREKNTIVIRREGERPIYRPIQRVLAIYNYGTYRFDTTFLSFLDNAYIPLHIFDRNGRYKGTFYNPPIPSSEVFVRQVEFVLDKDRVSKFLSALKESYEYNRALVKETLPSDIYQKAILSVFIGLMYATVVDGIYMTHLDPRVLSGVEGRGMPFAYVVFGIYYPSALDIGMEYIEKGSYLISDFYSCSSGLCLRATLLKKIFSYWEKIASATVRTERSLIPRRALIRREFYKIEKHIMWNVPYKPFEGLWHK